MLYGFGDAAADQAAADYYFATEDEVSQEQAAAAAATGSGTATGTSLDWTNITTTALNDVSSVVSAAFGLAKARPLGAPKPPPVSSGSSLLLWGGVAVAGVVLFMAMRKR